MDKKYLFIGIIIISFIVGLTGCFEESIKGESPVINYFTVTPSVIKLGNNCILKWSTIHAENVSINNGIGVVSINGSYIISPTEDLTYTITAVNSYGNSTAHVSIYVNDENDTDINDDILPNLTFSKRLIGPGLMVTLADDNLNWNEFTVIGGDAPIGDIIVGDFIALNETNGNNEIKIIYKSTNYVMGIWTWDDN